MTRGVGERGAGKGIREEAMSQNARSRSVRRSGGLPAMIAALIAPIEMPATHSGSNPPADIAS